MYAAIHLRIHFNLLVLNISAKMGLRKLYFERNTFLDDGQTVKARGGDIWKAISGLLKKITCTYI